MSNRSYELLSSISVSSASSQTPFTNLCPIMRQRRNKTNQARFKSPASSSRKKKDTVTFSYKVAQLLDAIGIRKLRSDPQLSQQQKRARNIDLFIAFVLFLLTLATRLYRIAEPAKIGKSALLKSLLPLSPFSQSHSDFLTVT